MILTFLMQKEKVKIILILRWLVGWTPGPLSSGTPVLVFNSIHVIITHRSMVKLYLIE